MAESAFLIALVVLAGTVILRRNVGRYLSRRGRPPRTAPVFVPPCCGPAAARRRLRRGRSARCAYERVRRHA
ncbi:hypothetical protein AB0L65_31315 [Nonomuraea sp. NPDC052116]|uniref:hypothetical protein n=1 Tax=Nonomuraea sp. NPDC052116 TaxID=3155665 RepID=UPI003440F2FB